MKQLEKAKDIYLKEYEVNVHPYLNLAQVELIVKGVCSLDNNDFAERKMNEDILLLFHATDITMEEIEATPYEDFVESGLIDAVKSKVKNIHLIKEGLEYAESFARSLAILSPKILPLMQKLGDLYGKDTNKK